MFGEFVVGDSIEVSFGKDVKVSVVKKGNGAVYEGPDDKKFVVVKNFPPVARIVPAPPRGKYLSFIVVCFRDNVMVPPGASVSMWARVPIGVKVYVDDVLVGYFNVGKIKRCLYDGFFGDSIIAGCVVSPAIMKRRAPRLVGGFNIVVKNSSDYPALVKMVPLFVSNTPLFYSGDVAYYPWYKVVVHNSYASVVTNYTSPVENMVCTGGVRLPVFEARIEIEKEDEVLVIGRL